MKQASEENVLEVKRREGLSLSGELWQFAWAPDGQHFATLTEHGWIVWSWPQALEVDKGIGTSLAWSSRGELTVARGSTATTGAIPVGLRQWEVRFPSDVQSLAWSDTGEILLASLQDGPLFLISRPAPAASHIVTGASAPFVPGPDSVVAYVRSDAVVIGKVVAPEPAPTPPVEESEPRRPALEELAKLEVSGVPTSMAWSPDGRILALATPERLELCFDPLGPKPSVLVRDLPRVASLAFMPRAPLLALAGPWPMQALRTDTWDSVNLVDADGGVELGEASSVHFHPEESTIAVVSADRRSVGFYGPTNIAWAKRATSDGDSARKSQGEVTRGGVTIPPTDHGWSVGQSVTLLRRRPTPAPAIIAPRDLPVLAHHLVLTGHADPELLQYLTADQFASAVRSSLGTNVENLSELVERARADEPAPHPLWLAWIRTVRSKELTQTASELASALA